MNTMHDNDDIPTLTDIIQPGDESMKDHFDARYFDNNEEQEPPATQSFVSDDLKESVDLLIQEALNEAMPAIEEQLREQLTRNVLEKLADRKKR